MKTSFIALLAGCSVLVTLSGCGKSETPMTSMPPVNLPPSATAATFTAPADLNYTGVLTGMDPEKAMLTYAVASAPSKGQLSLKSDGTFSYTPQEEVIGEDSFTFTVSDGKTTSPAAKVVIAVEKVTADFGHYSRTAFSKMETDTPAVLNTRELNMDVTEETAYDDVLVMP